MQKARVIALQIFVTYLLLVLDVNFCSAQCGPVISAFPYTEGFEAGPAWTTGVVSGTNNWAWGAPAHPSINAAGGGVNAWCVGGLTGSSYLNSDQCWIMSPCFDFTTLNYPWISFKIYWECERQWDGMTLQSSINGGVTWQNVGAFGDPVNCLNQNWFNYNNITWLNSLPAGSRHGWSGRTGPTVAACTGGFGSNGWVTATHCMPTLANQPNVRFRFLFGSGTTCNAYDGIAVDDIYINNAQPNTAGFNWVCAGGNTINFTNTSLPCPTTFTWNFGDPASAGSNTSTATNPSHTFTAPGNYTVTLTASGPCNAPGTISIPVSILGATITSTNVTCNGAANGSAAANVIGGSAPYTYAWSPTGGTGSSANNLPPNTYTVNVSAAGSCPTIATVIITQPPVLSATQSQTNILCNNATTGVAHVVAAGGTGPYSYIWNSGGNAATENGLGAGSYTCTITDANGCTSSNSFSITQPAALVASNTVSPSVCTSNNGSATASSTGGTGPYSYTWSNGGNTAAQTSLGAGSYTCTITDANGCTANTIATVPSSGSISVSIAAVGNVLCSGGNTGTATALPAGGTGPYIYAWSSGGNNATVTGLPAGSYTCTVTDANGCVSTQSITITQPTPVTAATSQSNVLCNGGNSGSATIIPSGGTGPYTYAWSPSGGNSATASSLSATTYTCLVTDSNNCTATASFNITQPPFLAIGNTSVPETCGNGNGSSTVTVAGGTGPYTYSWSSGGSTPTENNLVAGTYTCTVTDANGCTVSSAAIITAAAGPAVAITSTSVLCNGGNTGSATAVPSGGNGPYTYAWSSGGTAATTSNLSAGSFTCVITDANGCTGTQTVSIVEPTALIASITSSAVTCFGGATGAASAVVSGGTPVYAYSWSPVGGNNQNATALTAQNYSCTITDINGCSVTASVSVTEPSAVSVTTTSSDAHCNLADGSAVANANGGTGTLQYQWAGGPSTSNYNNVPSGNYFVVVTDQNGCTDTASVNVNNIPGVIASPGSTTNLTCFNSGDGIASVTAAGGNGPYTYTWLPAVSSSSSASGISAGTYQIVVTDADGCTSSTSVIVSEPPQLTLVANTSDSTLCAGQTTQLNCNANGGTPVFSYFWNPGPLSGSAQNVSPSVSTTYTAAVTDANGCTASVTILISVDAAPVVLFSGDTLMGCEPVCVNFADSSSVSAGNIQSWSWDFGDGFFSTVQNPSHCFTTPGLYTVSLTASTTNGCVGTLTQNNYINVFPLPVAGFTFSPQPATMFNPEITFMDASSGANVWQWNFGDVYNTTASEQNPSFIYTTADCYDVSLTVVSTNGCVDSVHHEVCLDPDIALYVPNTFTPNGDGRNDYFLPFGTGIEWGTLHMMIFDRWGNLIYNSYDYTKPWDGRVSGKSEIVQEDVYVWKISVTDATGYEHNLIGHVNVIR